MIMPNPRTRRIKKAARVAAWKKANGQEEAVPTAVVEEPVVEAVEEELVVEAAPAKPKKKAAKKPAKKKFAPKKVKVNNEN